MQYETTGGDIILTIPNCDCGLTGGCEKCQPIVLRKNPTMFKFDPHILPPIRIYKYDDMGNFIKEI